MNTGANVTVERLYRDPDGAPAQAVLLATYNDPDAGVYHAPTNCYRSNGWRLVEDSKVDVPVPGGPASGSAFRPGKTRTRPSWSLYWYRLGDYTLFER